MLKFLKNILQLLISPDNGWDDIMSDGNDASARRYMAWCIIIAMLSVFVGLLYHNHQPLVMMIECSIIILVVFWATLFIADFILNLSIPRMCDGSYDPRVMSLLTSYAVSLLTIQTILTNILPLSFAILELWPVYVVIILWRGMGALEIKPTHTGRYLLAVIVSFIVPSQLLMRAFYSFLR